MFSLLGDRSPLEVLPQTPDTLTDLTEKHSAAVLRTRPFEGKWSPNETIGYLSDSEWVYGYRLRLIPCEDNPNILGTNQDSWVASLRHNEREPSELVEIFRTVICHNSRLPGKDVRSNLRQRIVGPPILFRAGISPVVASSRTQCPQDSIMRRVHPGGAGHRVADEKQCNPVPLKAVCHLGVCLLNPRCVRSL